MKTNRCRTAAAFLVAMGFVAVGLVATSAPASADEVPRLRQYETTYAIPR